MEEQSKIDDSHYMQTLLKSSAVKKMSRLGVIAERGESSFALQMIRETVETYAVESLSELRVALMQQEAQGVIAADIRWLSSADIALLAPCLAQSRQAKGIVYVMTAEQFCLFEAVNFDFVYR